MDHLGDALRSPIAYCELLADRFKGAVLSNMAKALRAEHVEGNGIWMRGRSGREEQARFWMDEAADQPSGRNAVDAGSGTGHPDAVAVIGRFCSPLHR